MQDLFLYFVSFCNCYPRPANFKISAALVRPGKRYDLNTNSNVIFWDLGSNASKFLHCFGKIMVYFVSSHIFRKCLAISCQFWLFIGVCLLNESFFLDIYIFCNHTCTITWDTSIPPVVKRFKVKFLPN